MAIKNDGPITQGTRKNLIDGLRGRALSTAAVEAALEQSIAFSEKLVNTYSAEIAAGEVGIDGSGRASLAEIIADRSPTVLLYGRVQSGKTAAMILTSALCLDNGFRIIVVLTSDNVALVSQTANRFKALHGPRVLSSVKTGDNYEWQGQEDELRQDIATEGLVLICTKNSAHLTQVYTFLSEIGAPSYPALILDDEADNATPDTTIAARRSGRANAPLFESTIYRKVMVNTRPGEEGQSLSELFAHSLYVQVTATPFVLLLQKNDALTRPKFKHLLEPGEGYCGGEVFFDPFDPRATTPPPPPLVLVADTEGQAILRGTVPVGLANSLMFFVIAAAAKSITDGTWPEKGFKHLSHISHRTFQHGILIGHLQREIADLRRILLNDIPAATRKLTDMHNELRKTAGTATPALADIITVLRDAIRQTDFIQVNSETDVPEYGPRLNFVVGGNILGRGLTIDELLVTYYIREAQVSQMDTIWQHARMYGYRVPLMPYTRVYLPNRVAQRFKHIHRIETTLRENIRDNPESEIVLLEIAGGTRPTRPNALDNDELTYIGGDRQQIHPLLLHEDPAASAAIRQLLEANNVPTNERTQANRTRRIPLEAVIGLVNAVTTRPDDDGVWDKALVLTLMSFFEEQYNGHGYVYVRALQDNTTPPWPTGRLGGPEIGVIRNTVATVPVLALMYRGDYGASNAWYPTLLLPNNTPRYVFAR